MDPERNKTQTQGTQNAAGCRIQCNEERSGTQGPERDRMQNTQKACSTPYRRCTLTHSRNEVRPAFGVSKWGGGRQSYQDLEQSWMVLGPVGEEFRLLDWLSEWLSNQPIGPLEL